MGSVEKIAQMLAETVSKAVSSLGGNSGENQVQITKTTAFTVDRSDCGNDWFVKSEVPNERDSYNGFTVKGCDIPDAARAALLEAGGANANLSNVWIQPGLDNKVTYGITDSDGNRLWVRYELDEDGNAVEVKRTVIDEDGNTESTGTESKTDVPNVALNALKESTGVNISASSVSIQEMDDGKSFVYSAKDEQGRTTYIKYEVDEDGNFNEVKRTQELGNGKYQTIENNQAIIYTLTGNNEKDVESTSELDEDGNVVSIEYANGDKIDNETVRKLEAILGSDYNYATISVTNTSEYGDVTYNVKDKDGNDAWIRLDKDGNETARTIETEENEFLSIYHEDDVNEGQDGTTRLVTRTVNADGTITKDEAVVDSDELTFDDATGLETVLRQVKMAVEGNYDEGELSEDVLNIAGTIQEQIANGTIKNEDDLNRFIINVLSEALGIDPEAVAATSGSNDVINNIDSTDWFISTEATEEKDEWGGYTVDGEKVPQEVKDQIKRDFGNGVDLSEVWVQKNDDNLVTYGFIDENGNNAYIRYEIGEDGTLTEVTRTIEE